MAQNYLSFTGIDQTLYNTGYFTNGNTDNVQRVFDNCNGRYKRENCIGYIEIPRNRPRGYLVNNKPSINDCKHLCEQTTINGTCVAFMHNPDVSGGQCSMYINTDVGPDCGTNNPKYTWYDMRFFEDPATNNVIQVENNIPQKTAKLNVYLKKTATASQSLKKANVLYFEKLPRKKYCATYQTSTTLLTANQHLPLMPRRLLL